MAVVASTKYSSPRIVSFSFVEVDVSLYEAPTSARRLTYDKS